VNSLNPQANPKINPTTKKSLFIVWIVVSVIALLIQLAPFVFGSDSIQSSLPVCESIKETGTECAMCGMTRSFISISENNLEKADSYNKAGVFIYGLFSVNLIAIISVSIILAIKNLRRKKLCKQRALLSEY